MCDTPCCMHPSQVKSPMGTNSDKFSDTCQGKDVNGCSLDAADLLLPSLGCTCNGRHHASSETSNLLSACSSHDLFFQNAESEANLRASATSEDARQKVMEYHGFAKASKPDGDQIFSNQHGQQTKSECFGDDSSCVSGSHFRNGVAYSHDDDIETKNESCSLASVNSFPDVETPVNGQPASCYMLNNFSCKVDNNHTRGTDKFSNESSQAIVVCSNKSELSEISSLGVSSSETSSLKGKPSECPKEQQNSSLIRVTMLRVCGQIKDVLNYAECVNSDTELNDRIPAVEMTCPDQQKDFEKSIAKVEEPNIGEPPLHSQPVDYSKESDAAELEVKVCDICGDAGREDLLANCSKCSDGAEHIYCMRVKLDKIPEGDWMCEECILTEKTRNHMQDKPETVIARVSCQPSLHRTKEDLGSSSVYNNKNCLRLGVKGLSIEKIRTSQIKSSPYFSSKRPADCLEAVPMIKRRAFESIKQSGISRPLNETCLDCSFENFNKGKIKQTPEFNISGNHLSDHILGVDNKSHKLQKEYQMSRGSLSKSKSLKIMDSEGKVPLPVEEGVLKQNFARKPTVFNNKEAGGAARMMKSGSFISAISDNRNASDSKVVNCSSNFSHVEDLKRLRHAEGQSSTDYKCASKFHNPLVGSLVADAGVNVLMADEKSVCGKTPSPLTSGSVYHGLEDGKYPAESNEDLPWFLVNPSTIFVVPQLNYRWKGKFEIWGGGGLPHTCGGIQAHLPTHSSPKVLEVVQKLPQKILLEEVPHLNKWPTQFLENQATEDNIALYFFACDVESYKRGYKDLLEYMIKNDLILKGNVGEVEILILPSNLLPEKSQRWKKLFFLWGVLRGGKVNCSVQLPICVSGRNEDQPNKNQYLSDFPMSCSWDLSSCAHSNENLSAGCASHNVHKKEQSFTLLEPLASGRNSEICGSKVFTPEDRSVNLQTSLVIQDSGVYHAKTEHARDSLHMDLSKREERDSKRGQILHHSVKADSECHMGGARIYEERKNKRLKSCFNRMDEVNNFKDIKCLGETFSIGMNGLGLTFTSKNHTHGRAYNVPKSSTNFASINGRMELKSVQQQVILNDDSDRLNFGFPDLELSLGIGKKSAKQRVMSLFGTEDSENMLEKYSKTLTSEKRDEDESSLLLSLSLALPSPSKDRVLNPSSETQLQLPEWCGVNTALSL